MKRIYLISQGDAETVKSTANRLYESTSLPYEERQSLAHNLWEVLSNLSIVKIPDNQHKGE